MQVLILATGENEKLSPLSKAVHTCMLPVANRPIMSYTIEQLARQGYKHMLVSLFSQAHQVEAYFDSGQRWGVKLEYRLQRDALGTAGAIKWAEGAIRETFLVIPGDSLLELDIAAFLQHHHDSNSMASIVVHRSHESPGDNSDFMHAETGIYLFEPEVFDFIPARRPYHISTQLIPALRSAGKIVTSFVCTGQIHLLESFASYQAAQIEVLKSGFMNQPVRARQISNGIWAGRNNRIHPQARMAPPVLIGSNTWIDQGVELGPDVVVGSNVMILSQTQVQRSTILDNTYIGQMLRIEDRIVLHDLMIDVQSGAFIQLADHLLAGAALPNRLSTATRRLIEIVLAVTLLLFTLPLSLSIAIVTWFGSRQVFQQIPSLHHHPLRGKNRPMLLLQFAVRDRDGRTTRVGRWLQAFDLHRLPELWHVLTGEMHMVGVKPLPVEIAPLLTEEWQHKGGECLPGITGLWFTQPEQEDNLDEILLADAFYAATRSWRSDLKILLQTPAAWFRHVRSRGAFRRKKRSKTQWNL
jgi:NDP-sugar pyrophosphorylase family protein/lipopolysaccharide/colanic/teichoic acid biosynthesis glycosyltransferase